MMTDIERWIHELRRMYNQHYPQIDHKDCADLAYLLEQIQGDIKQLSQIIKLQREKILSQEIYHPDCDLGCCVHNRDSGRCLDDCACLDLKIVNKKAIGECLNFRKVIKDENR